MQISQMFKRKPCVFSIECFPPKQTANFGKMKDTLRTMRTLTRVLSALLTVQAAPRAAFPLWKWANF
ncbi:MAG: hypothetical protein ACLT8A_02370 [Subdoligranulum sp.]